MSEINSRGVVHEGSEYPVDVLIYATGFGMATSTFNMIVGREGRTLRDKWQQRHENVLGLAQQGFSQPVYRIRTAGRRWQL